LKELCALFNIEYDDKHHDALEDAKACLKVFKVL